MLPSLISFKKKNKKGLAEKGKISKLKAEEGREVARKTGIQKVAMRGSFK